ncbi:hypothetical protein KJ707_00835 [Patescibacteria group bacterium]|nr:hypothetical protein [Patescibacteria group bacterium]
MLESILPLDEESRLAESDPSLRVNLATANYEGEAEFHVELIRLELLVNDFILLASKRRGQDTAAFQNLGGYSYLHETAQKYLDGHQNLPKTLQELILKLLDAKDMDTIARIKSAAAMSLSRYKLAWTRSQRTYEKTPAGLVTLQQAVEERQQDILVIFNTMEEAFKALQAVVMAKKLDLSVA